MEQTPFPSWRVNLVNYHYNKVWRSYLPFHFLFFCGKSVIHRTFLVSGTNSLFCKTLFHRCCLVETCSKLCSTGWERTQATEVLFLQDSLCKHCVCFPPQKGKILLRTSRHICISLGKFSLVASKTVTKNLHLRKWPVLQNRQRDFSNIFQHDLWHLSASHLCYHGNTLLK